MAISQARRCLARVHQSANLQRVLAAKQDRADVLRYSYLRAGSRFADLGDKLHPDLQTGLDVNGYSYMTEVQEKAVRKGLLEGDNLVLTSETGSGKTLAYLLPVLNGLFHYKDRSQQGSPRFRLNRDTEDAMFLNAEEIMYKA